MTFQNYLCWEPEKVHEVVNPDAEAVAEEIFLAVHSDYPLLFSENPDQEIALTDINAHDFLHQYFLDRNRGDYVETMVLGESGSGKSHFIQWMYLNIPKQDDTYIFSIPKARTSLRTIVEGIVGLLPTDLANPYQQQLKNSDPITLNDRGKIDKLLGSISLAISQDNPQKKEAEELENYLINNLPYIFDDPYLRQSYFTVNHPLIADLVDHVFSSRSINLRAENRREFKAEDISLGGCDYVNSAFPTQEVLDLIGDGPGTEFFDLALEIINRNLNKALTLTLSLTPQQLINMMTDLRKYLYTQGKRLILLVEDLALLQGIDNALLQALTIPGRQGEERLCELRWAAAVTTGYYGELDETLRSRLTFRIKMDRPVKDIGREGLAEFAARYLNAMRIGPEKLKAWHRELHLGENLIPPNACFECPHQNVCHQGFGTAGTYGLYPFNNEALWNMARRVDLKLHERFLPRIFLTRVLRQTMHSQGNFIIAGEFPSENLRVGDPLMCSEDQQKMKNIDPENYKRRGVLLDIWHGKGEIANLNPIIHEAFALPLLSTLPNFDLTPKKITEYEQKNKPVELDKEMPELDQLERWAQGHEMQQSLATKLREALFKTLYEFIDWDSLSIDRSSVAGKKKPFTQMSFGFLRQLTTPYIPSIYIFLPKENDLIKTAIALKGLLQFHSLGHWNFPNGDIALTNCLECLQEWGEDIKQQIIALSKVTHEWDPGKAVVELLAIARALTSTKPEISVNFIISPDPLLIPKMRSNDLNTVITVLSEKQKDLQKLMQAIYSSKKGGQKGPFIYSQIILKTLESLRKNKWCLQQSPPSDLVGPYKLVADVYSRLKSNIDKAIINEIRERKIWQSGIITHIAIDELSRDIITAITRVRSTMSKVAIPGWDINDFEILQNKFRKARLEQLLKNNAFDEQVEGNEVLSKLASTQKDQMEAVDVFVNKVQNLLRVGENGLANRQNEYSATIKPLNDIQTRIETAFLTLQTLFEELQ